MIVVDGETSINDIDQKLLWENYDISTNYVSPIVSINHEVRRKNGSAAAAFSSGIGPGSSAFFNIVSNDSSDPWDYSLIISPSSESENNNNIVLDDPTYYATQQQTETIDGQGRFHTENALCSCHTRKRRASSSVSATATSHRLSIATSPPRRTIGQMDPYKQKRITTSLAGTSAGYDSRTEPISSEAVEAMPSEIKDERSNKSNDVCPRCGKKRNLGASSSSGWTGSRRRFSLSGGCENSNYGGRTRTYSIVDAPVEDPKHAEALLHSTPQLRFLNPSSTNMQGTPGTALSSTNVFLSFMKPIMTPHDSKKKNNADDPSSALSGINSHRTGNEYFNSLMRNRANKVAASELASLLWLLAHEMSSEDYGAVESDVFKLVFSLVHSSERDKKIAGLAALDALLSAPSADEEKKSIKFANTLSNSLRAAAGDYEFSSAVSQALGHMAMRTANVDFVEAEVARALEWLRTERSDRRLAACLSLKEFAMHLPTTFHSKTSSSTFGGGSNEFLDHIFQAIRDPQPIVRACAADSLSQCLKILVERRHSSLIGLLCQVYFCIKEGLQTETPTQKKKPTPQAIMEKEAARHGSLLAISSMVAYAQDFVLPRYEEICRDVLACAENPYALIRLEVIRLIPRLARRNPPVFGRRYLEQALMFLMASADNPTPARVGIDLRPSAYTCIGQLVMNMTDETGEVIGGSRNPTLKITDDPYSPGHGQIVELLPHGIIYQKLGDIFTLVRKGLRSTLIGKASDNSTVRPALHCAAKLVEALGELAVPYAPELISDMFKAGLSNDLISCLQMIAEFVPEQQGHIEERMLQGVSICLAGMSDVYAPLSNRRELSAKHFGAEFIESTYRPRVYSLTYDPISGGVHSIADSGTEVPTIMVNMSTDPSTVRALCLSLQTLASFGGTIGKGTNASGVLDPLLPLVQDVAARYLSHSVADVRRAAVMTCIALLVSNEYFSSFQKPARGIGTYSGLIIETVLQKLLRTAVSDPSGTVRLCVVRSLDSRYDVFLCQTKHLQELFLLLQDEALSIRAAGLRLLGRLATLNPGPILPVLRRLLSELILELQCGVDTGRIREDATRLLVVYLRAKPLQRLVHPVLSSLVDALPLDTIAPPRLASASLEALGELAQATCMALQPRVKDLVSHVLEIMRDRSSASKQRTSLRTLGQLAGSTGYVVRPYVDFPKLMTLATEILPATKRAPWSLRREVIRTLGILGALDPDRYRAVASKSRKGGAVGGAYFEVDLDDGVIENPLSSWQGATNLHQMPDGYSSTKSATTADGFGNDVTKKKSFTDGTLDASFVDDDDSPAYLSMYEQYAMVAQPVSNLPPAKRITPSDDEFYPTVAIQALMRIFRDPSLAVHHGMVAQAVMFIFKSLNLRCVPYLGKVVPRMIYAVRTCGPSNLRESLLKHLATLSQIVKEQIRPYVEEIFDVVEQFWSSRHLSTVISLISNLAIGVPDEFRKFVPKLIHRLLSTLDELQVSDWSVVTDGGHAVLGKGQAESEKLRLILKSVSNLKIVLGDYLNILVPALLKLADSIASLAATQESGIPSSLTIELSILIYRTISSLLVDSPPVPTKVSSVYYSEVKYLSKRNPENSLSSRVVQSIVRIFREKPPKSPSVGLAMTEALCVCIRNTGYTKWIQLYDDVVREAIEGWQSTLPQVSADANNINRSEKRMCAELYDEAVQELVSPTQHQVDPLRRTSSFMALEGYHFQNTEFTSVDNITDSYDTSTALLQGNFNSANRQQINQSSLQRAWDVSQRTSRDDWDEWMRRFAIQLLREAPSPALRATASLAHAYQPLARELFSAAFACCWKELSEPYQLNLVHALKTAFVADVSPEILQALLNLAEFMEHEPFGGLPIEITDLAELALKCRAYAKALHYKEREYTMGGSSSCVESLISINGKLDLPEAALGVLKAASIGDALMQKTPLGEDNPSKVSNQAYDMFYSVFWNTEERDFSSATPVDLSAKRDLWLAKLGSWTEALAAYEGKLKDDPGNFEAIVGCMQCLVANGEWQKVLELADDYWVTMMDQDNVESGQGVTSSKLQRKIVRMSAEAAWRLGQWSELEKFSTRLLLGSEGHGNSPSSGGMISRDSARPAIDFDGAFYSAVLHIHRKEWVDAAYAIDAARFAMDGRLTALMAESYSRAYPSMVTAQTLAEMEEVIEFRKTEERSKANTNRHPVNSTNEDDARSRLLSVWRERLVGCRVDAEVHSSILAVRSLVLGPAEEVESTITLSDLSRQANRFKFAERVLLDPLETLGADLNGKAFGFGLSETLGLRVDFSVFAKNAFPVIVDRVISGDLGSIVPIYGPAHDQWTKVLVNEAGGLDKLIIQYRLYFAFVKHLWYTERRDDALNRLTYLSEVVDMVYQCENVQDTSLLAGCWVELGEWKLSQSFSPSSLMASDKVQAEVLTAFKRATMLVNCGYKAWHAWALMNFRIALQLTESDDVAANLSASNNTTRVLLNHIVSAVRGFANAISRGTKKSSASVQQDLLNLLTCLFKFGNFKGIATVINNSIPSIAIEAWLGVLPQLLARIHIKDPAIRSVLHPLLTRLGEKHPQALMYPLSVLVKSPVAERKNSAESLMNSLKNHSSDLVEDALMVSSELIRVAILWLETWHEGLDDASQLYCRDGNVVGMLDLLLPLHENLERGAGTKLENDFLKSFGQDLEQAHLHLKDYIMHMNQSGSGRLPPQAEAAMNFAWDIYYTVFRRINKQLPSLTNLELSQCSPALSRARSLELGVPGSYRVDGSYVKIEKFIPNVEVITSKQRPRRITLRGSDGQDYVFLLKGHEDLRQDERVMQLFGLVNALLIRDHKTRKHDLQIQRYAISPLSHNCGVVGWVPHCDTLHSLISDYRKSKKIPLNMENREMLKLAPDFDLLTVMQKVEVFVEALKMTTGKGNDLYEILWLKSTNSEEWLERRTKYTRSLAVMSMVGYILGLGDRHPSNLMLDKISGRILHIDFGDCFEVAMNRDKYPEHVPFRLTRMLIKAMEVSGIEGSYRSTCEQTMSVLRDNSSSLVAMLEAFVYDPLISWRLADLPKTTPTEQQQQSHGRNSVVGPISEDPNEEDDDVDGHVTGPAVSGPYVGTVNEAHLGFSTSTRARSMQIYANIQSRAASLNADSRIASITGNRTEQAQAGGEGSLARSRIERSMRQRELMSLLGGENGAAHEEALNEKALRVIRRVQDKLSGTDFPDCIDGEPMDVPDQVQRLIVQATSVENLCSLYIGWCSFW